MKQLEADLDDRERHIQALLDRLAAVERRLAAIVEQRDAILASETWRVGSIVVRPWGALASLSRPSFGAVSDPRLSILVPVYDPAIDVLKACIESVFAQTSDEWELHLFNDGSSNPAVAAALSVALRRDVERVHV